MNYVEVRSCDSVLITMGSPFAYSHGSIKMVRIPLVKLITSVGKSQWCGQPEKHLRMFDGFLQTTQAFPNKVASAVQNTFCIAGITSRDAGSNARCMFGARTCLSDQTDPCSALVSSSVRTNIIVCQGYEPVQDERTERQDRSVHLL